MILATQQRKKKEFKKLKVDYQKEMESTESILIEEKKKVQKTEKAAKEAENAVKKAEKTAIELKQKLTAIEIRTQEAASRTLIEFYSSKEYEDALADTDVDAYQLRCKECKKQVCHLTPKLDPSSI